MTVRVAALRDAAEVAALEELGFGLDAWSARQVEEELTGSHRRAWVATIGPAVVGYAVTMTVAETADLLRIGVHPAHRRHGIAHRLLSTACAQALADGAEQMLLEVGAGNSAALSFYAGAGFHEVDRRPRYYRDGSDAVVLRCGLGNPPS